MVPTMSAGSRSGVNWMRWNLARRQSATVLTAASWPGRHAFEQHVAAGEQADQDALDHVRWPTMTFCTSPSSLSVNADSLLHQLVDDLDVVSHLGSFGSTPREASHEASVHTPHDEQLLVLAFVAAGHSYSGADAAIRRTTTTAPPTWARAAAARGGGRGDRRGAATWPAVVPCICPTGSRCDSAGVCVGGDDMAIGIDVKTVNVGGVITLNGAAPTTLPACNAQPASAKANVHLVDTARGYAFDLPVPCSATTFAWTGVVFPGTYKVTVTGDSNYSSLPTQAFMANASADVSADAMNIALDVKTASVAGTVTLNGAAPTTTAACTGNAGAAKATVHLVDNTDGYRFDFDVPCSSTTFAWGGVVFPGTYAVSVDGDPTYSNVPTAPFTANSALAVSGSVANQALAIQTMHAAGTVTINGATPTATCPSASTSYTKAVVHLSDAKDGYRFDVPVTCAQTDWAWSGNVYPGTYVVTVDGGDGYSNIPPTAFQANAALAVTNDVSGQALTSRASPRRHGHAQRRGAGPERQLHELPDGDAGDGAAHRQGQGLLVRLPGCVQRLDADVDRHVFPGNYRITVAGDATYSNLPTSAFVSKDGQAISGATTNLALDVKTDDGGRHHHAQRGAADERPGLHQQSAANEGGRAPDQRHARLRVRLRGALLVVDVRVERAGLPRHVQGHGLGQRLLEPAERGVPGQRVARRVDGGVGHGARRQDGAGRRHARAQRRRAVDDDGVQSEPDGDQGLYRLRRSDVGLCVPGAGGVLGDELRVDGGRVSGDVSHQCRRRQRLLEPSVGRLPRDAAPEGPITIQS